MSKIEKLNMIAQWQEQHKQLIEDLDISKKRIAELEKQIEKMKHYLNEFMRISVASVEEFEPEFSELVGEVEAFLKE